MTRKAKLQSWAGALGANCPADATAAELEQAIEAVLTNPVRPDCSGLADDSDIPQYSLGQGLANNARVIREGLPSAAKAVVANLLG